MSQDRDCRQVDPGIESRIRYVAWLPCAGFALAIAALGALHIGPSYAPPFLLAALNIAFLTAVSFVIFLFAANSYLASRSASLFFLACGVLVLGMGAMLAALPLVGHGANWTVTVYNTSACLAAVLHLASAAFGASRLGRRKSQSALAGFPVLGLAILAVAMGEYLLAALVHSDTMPVFFIEARGATALNKLVLWASAAMFGASSVIFLDRYRRDRTPFAHWYGLGLALIAMGLIGVSMQSRLGSPLNWASRFSQYLGGVYMLVAVLATARSQGRWQISLEAALHEVEERYKSLDDSARFAYATINALSANICVLDETGLILAVNKAWRDFAQANGCDPDRVSEGTNYLQAADEATGESSDEAASFAEGIRAVLQGKSTFFMEEYPCHGPEQRRWFVGRATLLQSDGPRRAVVAHEDITVRKIVEEIREKSERSYAQAELLGGFGHWQRDFLTKKGLWSPGACLIFGIDSEKAETTFEEFLGFVHPADRDYVTNAVQRALEERTGARMEYRFIRPDGVERIIDSVAVVLLGEAGEVRGLRGTVQDITELRHVQNDLRMSEARLALALESGRMGMWEWNVRTNTSIWNEQEYELLGLPPGDGHVDTDLFFRHVHPDDINSLRESLLRVTGEGLHFSEEFRIIRADGCVRWLAGRGRAVSDSGSGVDRLIGVNYDITEQMEAEKILRESENRYHALFDNAPIALWEEDYSKVNRALCELRGQGVTDLEAYFREHPEAVWALIVRVDILGVNMAAARLHRATGPEELRSKIHGVFSSETFEALRDGLIAVATGAHEYETESAVQTLDGEKRDVLVRWVATPTGNGESSRVYLSILDITERKRAEELLALAAREWETTFDAIHDAVWLLDREFRIVRWNKATERLLNVAGVDLKGVECWRVFHRSTEPPGHCLAVRIRASLNRESVEDQIGDHWYAATAYPVLDDAGKLSGVVHVVSDITERKQAGVALEESEERYRSLVSTSMDAVLLTIPDGRVLSVNSAACRMFGYSEEELIALGRNAIVDSTDPRLAQALEERARSGRLRCELMFKRKDGTRFPGEIASAVFTTRTGEKRTSMVIRDLTEQKRVEAALREASTYARSLIEASPDALVTIGADGRITDVNQATEEVTGVSRKELIGTDFSSYFTEPARARAGYEQVFREGEVRDYALVLRHRDGRTTPVLYNATVYRDDRGEVVGVFAAARDVTERKQSEEKLAAYQKRLRRLTLALAQSEERERRQVALHLHDEVGQSLSAIRVKFATWRNMKDTLQRQALLNDIEGLIDRVMGDIRRLTFELSPPILYELGLGPALERLGETLCGRVGVAFDFRCASDAPTLSRALSVELYRMARELIVNALKHAHANHVSVAMSGDSEGIWVAIEDDGGGLDPARFEQAASGRGGTFGLFSVRERLRDLDGSLELKSRTSAGTRIEMAVPLAHPLQSESGGGAM